MIVRQFTKGDLLVPVYAILQDGAGNAINLADQAVKFYMKNAETDVMKVNGSDASVVDAAAGEVIYAWIAGDVDTVGKYWGWFVRSAEGKTGTHPIGKKLLIEIVEAPSD